jgi:hypothetical protein
LAATDKCTAKTNWVAIASPHRLFVNAMAVPEYAANSASKVIIRMLMIQ